MTKNLSIVLRGLTILYVILLTVPSPLTLARNTTAEIILNPEQPILVRYDNRSQEITTYSILEVQLPVDVCLANYTSACIELQINNKSYVSSVSVDNALFLIASQVGIFVKVIEFRKIKYISGEGLMILIQLQDTLNIEHVAVKSVLKLSSREKSNITSLSLARLENHAIYISINYDKGRLPFMEFNNGDIVKILLDADNNLLELLILLRESRGWNHNEYSTTQLYTRVANGTQNNIINNTVAAMQYRGSSTIRSSSSYVFEDFTNPLFIVATVLLIISMVMLYRANNGLNK